MRIGVFDSGVGGQSVANAILLAMPELDVLLREDREHLPYGNKTKEELLKLVTPILHEMVGAGCEIIVVACNTVSTTIIEQLRKVCTVPLIGLEPMVKPAAEQTATGVIAVCATPSTLASDRYAWLKQQYAPGVTVIEPDCADWSYMIEYSQIDHAKISAQIIDALQQDADVIVLGCTHYHWIEQEIRELCEDKAIVLQPEDAVVAQLKQAIAQLS